MSEPPLHADCAAYALRVCPRLVTGHHTGQVYVAESTEYHLLEERITVRADGSLTTHVSLPGEHPGTDFAPTALQRYLALPNSGWTRADQWLNAQT
ncbi:hypothetical protein ACFRMQ_21690 [Kitasatospora sp. NPDC056783]|uniref:hypothetical protein n=1 Tax=Kitasatospora sp. NPDC056783 TaxID=3345943 RepID=UPI0036938342